MALTYHKATTDDGGVKGDEIFSGDLNTLLREVTQAEQTSGVTISRKFYIANSAASDFLISALSMDSDTAFTAILFESSGDAQVVGDLLGTEVDESPITITIPATSHKSFWVQIDVPALSTVTDSYGTSNIKQIEG